MTMAKKQLKTIAKSFDKDINLDPESQIALWYDNIVNSNNK